MKKKIIVFTISICIILIIIILLYAIVNCRVKHKKALEQQSDELGISIVREIGEGIVNKLIENNIIEENDVVSSSVNKGYYLDELYGYNYDYKIYSSFYRVLFNDFVIVLKNSYCPYDLNNKYTLEIRILEAIECTQEGPEDFDLSLLEIDSLLSCISEFYNINISSKYLALYYNKEYLITNFDSNSYSLNYGSNTKKAAYECKIDSYKSLLFELINQYSTQNDKKTEFENSSGFFRITLKVELN